MCKDCEGSGDCSDCNLFDCYYNDTVNPDKDRLSREEYNLANLGNSNFKSYEEYLEGE